MAVVLYSPGFNSSGKNAVRPNGYKINPSFFVTLSCLVSCNNDDNCSGKNSQTTLVIVNLRVNMTTNVNIILSCLTIEFPTS